MFKFSPASLQTFIDTLNCVLEYRVQHSTVHIRNVFCDGHLQIISCVGIVCTLMVRRTYCIYHVTDPQPMCFLHARDRHSIPQYQAHPDIDQTAYTDT